MSTQDSARLPVSQYPCLCLAGKQFLVANDAGNAVLIDRTGKGAVLGGYAPPDGCGATPALSGERIFVRGGECLYRLGRVVPQRAAEIPRWAVVIP